MNPPTEAPDVPEDSGEYFQNLDRNPAYSQYDASSWQGNPAPDPAGLFTPTYPQYNQNQGPTNVHNAAAWSSYVPENGSQALNYYNGQHPYGLTNSTGASRPDTFSANYFAPDYSTGLGNPQQNNVVAPNQLQRVPVNGSSTSDHTQGLSMSSNPGNATIPKSAAAKKHESPTPASFPSQLSPSYPFSSDPVALVNSLPKQKATGGFFSIRDFSVLAENQLYVPMKSASYATLSSDSADIDAKKGTIPAYKKRESSEGVRKYWNQQKPGQAKNNTTSGPPLKKPKLATEKLSRTRKEAPASAKQKASPALQQVASPDSPDTSDESLDEEESNAATPDENMELSEYLPLERPDDPEGAIRHDTIKALWLTKLRVPTADEISQSLKSFWDVMSGLRDQITALQTEIKALEGNGTGNELTSRKSKLDKTRSLIDVAVEAALKRGHPQNLEHLGEVHLILLSLREVLVARLAEKNVNSPSVKAILKLMSQCKTITEELSANLKLPKVFDRYKKAGDDEVKAFLNTISLNVTNATKKQKEKSSSDQIDEENAVSKPVSRLPTANTNPKRLREEEPKTSVNKRPTTASGIASSANPSKGDGVSLDSKSSVTASKSRPVAPTKSSGFFKDLQSASKVAAKASPQASTLKRPQAKPVAPTSAFAERRPPPKTTAPPLATSAPVFSFSQTMANLNKPREPVKAPAGPPETEEEKKERLRKEERRRRRVHWREEKDLVQVRIFEDLESEEPEGGNDVIKDVRDAAQEGRALKRHLNAEDEEDDAETLRPWEPLQELDFSSLPEDRQRENITTRGGKAPIKSGELLIQKKKEAETLMVVYMMQSDMPPSPREPPYSAPSSEQKEAIDFGQPKWETKLREWEIDNPGQPFKQYHNQSASGNNSDLDSILSSLKLRQDQQQIQYPVQSGQAHQPLMQSSPFDVAQHDAKINRDHGNLISFVEAFAKKYPVEAFYQNHPKPWLVAPHLYTPPPPKSLPPSSAAPSVGSSDQFKIMDEAKNLIDRAIASSGKDQTRSQTPPPSPQGQRRSSDINIMLEELPRMVASERWPTDRVNVELKTIAAADGGWSDVRFILEGLKITAARQAQKFSPRYGYDPNRNGQTVSAPPVFGFNGNQNASAPPIPPMFGFNINSNAQVPLIPPMFGFNNQPGQAAPAMFSFNNDQLPEAAPSTSTHSHQSQNHGSDNHMPDAPTRRKEDRWHESSEAARKSREAHNESKKFTAPCKYYKDGRCAKGASCTYLHTD